ncbi:IS607 family transposase [Aquifex sp.]
MLLTAQKIKELYGIYRNTLLNWEKKGLLIPVKTPGEKGRYKKEDIEKLLGLIEEKSKPKVILYARVSTKKQEDYLKNQIARLEKFAKSKGWNYEVIFEIASEVNENRRGLRKLLNKVKRESSRVELIVLNGEENEEDRTKELAEDLIAIVTSFVARIKAECGGKKKNVKG